MDANLLVLDNVNHSHQVTASRCIRTFTSFIDYRDMLHSNQSSNFTRNRGFPVKLQVTSLTAQAIVHFLSNKSQRKSGGNKFVIIDISRYHRKTQKYFQLTSLIGLLGIPMFWRNEVKAWPVRNLACQKFFVGR